MKITKKAKFLALLLSAIMVFCSVDVTAFAADKKATDAMTAIEAAFLDKKIGSKQSLESDGYIGIPLEVTTYYDYATHGAAKPGYNGTIAAMYVVNTGVERIGAKSDVEIITSMLSRGYIVSVFDYKNHAKAVSPALDFSTQTIRNDFQAGVFFKDSTKLPSGTYRDNFVVPAGYDISYGNIFFEADKHASDGTLEKIVENWNTDFRNWNSFENKIIYWRNSLGEQKATESGAEWFSDSAGKTAVDATAANANYTKVKYTIANDVTDCVGPDGKPIDLNLYMHIVYPTTSATNPIDPVPVAVLASSAEYLTTNSAALRPQHNGFLFNGYAGATFDYLYQPMAQSDYWGYYDGQTSQGALTGDRMNYGLHLYSDKKVNTAAMRYLRYLTYTQGDEFAFDDESIGVFGNSKGGWFTFLGEAELKTHTVENSSVYSKAELEELINDRINSYTCRRQFVNHMGETRYDNGITAAYTKNGVTIDGGELQPWLTYTDKNGKVQEILSYASWIYASNGSQYEDITEGHAPVYAALHLQDDFETTKNLFAEVTKKMDIPSMYVIVDLGHTFAYGPDYYYGYDTYQAMFDFANYYLKNDAVKVVYTSPADKTGEMSTTDPITVKFSGAVPANEIEKATLSAGGEAISGKWSAVRGNTEWTFTPSEELLAETAYTLTVPASLCGDNEKAMGKDYTASFFTESEGVYDVIKTNGSKGTYFTVTVPRDTSAADAKLRFYVSNDAANTAEVYTVSDFDASNPDGATKGKLVDEVNLKGAGYYSVDISKYVLEANKGDTLTFLLQQKKTARVRDSYNLDFSTGLSDVTKKTYVSATVANAPDNTPSAEFKVKKRSATYQSYYENTTEAFTNNKLFGTSALTKADYGRQYKVTLRVYDTVSRVVQISLGRATGTAVRDQDAQNYNFVTRAGEWCDLTFDYTVYEMEYGKAGLANKTLDVRIAATGKNESPIYFSNLNVIETITDVEFDSASLVLGQRGSAYKENGEGNAFSIGSNTYATFKAAISAAKSGNTIKLNKNYTFTSDDDFTGWGALGNITIDLNGYKLYSTSSNPVIHAAVTSTAESNVTIKNGDIYLSNGALIGYSGSTAAGKGKKINVTLENLNVLNSDGAMVSDFISASSIESASGATVNVKLNNVNIDFKKSYNSKNPVKILANGGAALKVSYTVKGGSIKLDGVSAVTLYDTFKFTKFEKDANGNYTKLYVPEGIEIPTYSVNRGNILGTFKLDSSKNMIATYTVQDSEYATAYGLIPEEYLDTEAYPFVVFDEKGNFLGAYSKWLGLNGSGGVIPAARNYVINSWNGTTYGDSPKEAFVCLRRDYTFESAEGYDNLAQVQGTINIDLGGNILSTGTQAKPLLDATAKGFSGAAGQKIFPTTINFMNGYLRQGKNGIVRAKTWDSMGDGSVANKHFNFNFTNVTFGFVEGGDTVGLIAHVDNPQNKSGVAPYNLTYNDCTFDLRTTVSKYNNNALLFKIDTAGKYAKVTHVVNGGKIIANKTSGINITESVTNEYGSSVKFAKGSDGNYLSFVIPSTVTAPTGTYKTISGIDLAFTKNKVSGNDTIYTLTEQGGGNSPEEPSDEPAVEITYTNGSITNTGSNSAVTVGAYNRDATTNGTKFVAASNVSYTSGRTGDANGAIVTNHKNGPHTVVSGYNFGTNDFTISTWFNVPTAMSLPTNNCSYIMGTSSIEKTNASGTKTTDGFGITLRRNGSDNRFEILMYAQGKNNGLKVFPGFAYGQWQNLTIVREGNTLKMYGNGTLLDTATLTDGFSFGSKALSLGGYYGEPWNYQDANIYYDDVQIYGEAHDSTHVSYAVQIGQHQQTWSAQGNAGKTTLFIGDSFMTLGYWKTFYDTYAGQDALLTGIAGATTKDWDIWADTYLSNTSPKNLVVHLGTNDLHNVGTDPQTDPEMLITKLQALFTKIHGLKNYEDVKIYYFSIPYKGSSRYDGDPFPSTFKAEKIDVVNEAMKTWCAERGWITYMETYVDATGKGLITDTMYVGNGDASGDATHLKAENYYLLTDALDKTDIVIENK